MFNKLLLIILAFLLTTASLLVIRQQRLDLAHRASRLHRDATARETTLWNVQQDIAVRCRPEDVRLAMEQLDGAWVPIPTELPRPPLTTTTRVARGE